MGTTGRSDTTTEPYATDGTRSTEALPRTASPLPTLFVIGLALLGAAAALRLRQPRTE
jgi:hypothetical protein